jgi:curved DNA-binding protein CbpA
MIEAERYYRILELEPGASPEEVHQGYLDLTWVWHPDRFTGHPRLQQKAQSKLQQLNEAHERLRSFRSTPRSRDLRANSKSQTSPPSYDQSSTEEELKQSKVHQAQAWVGEDKRTTKECRRPVSFKSRDVNEWLD